MLPLEDAPKLIVLCLGRELKISANGLSIRPKAKKARGLLALMAMSTTHTLAREEAAVTLWSNAEREYGLTRLRDLLHDLRKELLGKHIDILDVQMETISLKPHFISVTLLPVEEPESNKWDEFLIDLEKADPALDRWLIHVRAEGRRGDRIAESTGNSEQVSFVSNERDDRPTVVVTELDVSGVAGDAISSRALTDQIGACLARSRWFSTVTRDLHGQRIPTGSDYLPSIADYMLVGTLQFDVSNCRLLLKLIDLRNRGAIEWTASLSQPEPFNSRIMEMFANAVAAQLDTELLFIEARRQRQHLPSKRHNAYRLILEAIPAIYRLERDPFFGAGHLLGRAISLDRESAIAHSWMAYWHVFHVGQGWATLPAQSMKQAEWAANRAKMLDPKDARAITISGHVKAFLSGKLDEAAAIHNLALQINPALVLAWHFSGMTHAYAGRLNDALHCILRCNDLAPNDPHAFYAEGALGIIHLLRREHDRAVALGRRVTERQPNFTSAYKSYLSALGHLGRRVEAASVLQRLLALEPHFSIRRFQATAPYQRKEDLDHFIAGLRLAGIS